MASPSPRVSAITATYNGVQYLGSALESMLGQTFSDFEYIVVDDASTDQTPEILRGYAARDARLVVLRNEVNRNPSVSLNRALQVAQGEYVAVLDHDDLAHPKRLALQVAYLDTHPEIGVLGAQVTIVSAQGQPLRPLSFPTTPESSRWQILFGAPCQHSAVLLRRALALQVGGYEEQQWWANDYQLLINLLKLTNITNLPETLASYRRHPGQTLSVYTHKQLATIWMLIYTLLVERLNLRVSLDEIGLLYRAGRGASLPDAVPLRRAANLLLTIRERYLNLENLSAITRADIDNDCARRLVMMAWTHRSGQPEESRMLFQTARDISPEFCQGPGFEAFLKRLEH